MPKHKVVFLCTGNSARSQMAEAFLRKYAGDRFEIFSAGLDPEVINPYTYWVMEEVGLNLNGQWSKNVNVYLGKKTFNYVISVCAHAEENCPATFLGMGIYEHWNFEDPAALIGSDDVMLAKFREVRDQINIKILEWITKFNNHQR